MADFPRNIRLDRDTKDRLVSYLDTEIQNHRAERSTWVSDLENWQIDYWAKPAEEIKTFPFKGACNIVIPLTAIAVEAVHAREMTTFFALNQFVTLKLPEQFEQFTNGLERAIDKILLDDVDIYSFADQTLLENKKLGSAIGKSGYQKIIKRAVRTVGDVEQTFEVVTKQGPTLDGVRLAAFIMPFTCIDPQTAPWCGEEHIKSPYDIKLMSESGFFYEETYDEYLQYINQGQSVNISSYSYDQTVKDLQDQTPIRLPREVAWHEIWLGFDVDGDGYDEEIVVHYHWPSQTFFSIRYNWHDDLRRPYEILNYFPMEYRWAGLGIGKQNEQLQMEVTTQHRQRIDNATLANMRMYKVKDGNGYGPNEPVFPGKLWIVDEMDDVQELVMTEVYPSSYNNEQQAAIWSNQRTGVSELTLGMPQVGTPGTATGDLSRVQEANRKYDYTHGKSKRFLLCNARNALLEAAQFGFRDASMFSFIPNGDMVQQMLTMPADNIKQIIFSGLDLAGQNSNKLIDRNTWTQLAGITQQYYQGMIQLAMMMGNQQLVGMIGMKALVAATEVYKQILEAYDVRSIDKIALTNLINGLTNVQPNGIPGSGSPLIGPPQGMGGNPPINQQAGGAGRGGSIQR